MRISTFLELVWPNEGHYCLAIPFTPRGSTKSTYTHKVFSDIDEAAEYAAERKSSKDIFFCVGALREPRVWNPKKIDYKTGEPGAYEQRTHANILALKALFLDLDVGNDPKKYPSQIAAIADLDRVIAETRLPEPMLVSSGGGVHVYWLLSEGLPAEDWRLMATSLKRLTTAVGMLADPMRTSDAASVLRVAGTFNHKDPENPRKVKVIREGEPSDPDQLRRALHDALIRAGGKTDAPRPRPEQPAHDAHDDGFEDNTSRKLSGPPPTIKALVKTCAQVRAFARSGGNVSEPAWYAMLQLIRFVEEGEYWCHRLSKGAASYDRDVTQRRLDNLELRSVGPTMCETIADRCGSEHCIGCPLQGKGTSPMAAARRNDIAPQPVVVSAVPTVPDFVIPDPPPTYRRTRGEGIFRLTTNADGEDISVQIYEHDLYPIRQLDDRTRIRTSTMWRAHLPHGKTVDLSVDSGSLFKPDTLGVALAHSGVFIDPEKTREVQSYMVAYIKSLQEQQESSTCYNSLGWQDDFTTFVLPGYSFDRTGKLAEVSLSPHAESSAQAVRKAGTLERQIELMGFYNYPAYLAQQVMVAASLSTPLFHMTGHAGVVINATGDPGASKSTSLYTGASLWAHPTKFPLNGTNHGATPKARAQRMQTMGSLPVCVDEITTMSHKDAQEMVMSITQPASRAALNQDGTERVVSDNDKATMMLCTANNSLHGLLAYENSAGTAGSMRVIEIGMQIGTVHSKAEADEYLRELRENFGHIGELFAQHVATNYEQVKARVHAVVRLIDEKAQIRPGERFWSAGLACPIVATEIAVKLGLLPYSAKAMLEWVLTHQIPHMRGVVTAEYDTPHNTLANFLETFSSAIIVVRRSDAGANYVMRAPAGQMVAHYDQSGGKLWVLKRAFKDYCVRIGANAQTIVDVLAAGGQPAVVSPDVKRILGLGTEFAKAQSRCFIVDMRHPDISGVVDLSVVEGSQKATTPAGNKISKIRR